MIIDDGDNVTKLPIKSKAPMEDRPILEVPYRKCGHLFTTFIVDDTKSTVECGKCGEALNPMFVLKQLANGERRWREAHERYQDEMQRLAERERTKCNYCGKMTRISRR